MIITREMINCVNKVMGYNEDNLTIEEYAFYYKCLFVYGMGLIDADEYAMLNNVIGYDIGVENARKINAYLYDHDISMFDLIHDNDCEQVIQEAIEILNLELI